MILLLDENLPPAFASILDMVTSEVLGEPHSVISILGERFGAGATDIAILTEIGNDPDEWVIFTKDKRMRKCAVERKVLISSGAYYISIPGNFYKADQDTKLWKMIRVWKSMLHGFTSSKIAKWNVLDLNSKNMPKLDPIAQGPK